MSISLVVAHDLNRGIGKDNKLLWSLPQDMTNFKRLTEGNIVLMGRKTHESIGKKLPNRDNLVLTSDYGYLPMEGCTPMHNPIQAFAYYMLQSDREMFIIGGAEIYKLFMHLCDTMHITVVDGVFEADCRFPEFDESEWEIVSKEYHPIDDRHEYAFTIYQYNRVK